MAPIKVEVDLLKELDNVSKIHILERSDIDLIMTDISKKVVLALKIERLSAWLFNSEKTAMISIGEYDKRSKKFSKDSVLQKKDFPSYFKGLSENKIIHADNIHTNPLTKELNELYSKPNDVYSLLDIPLRIGGDLMGVMCCEKTGSYKTFSQDEISFAFSVSFVLASNLESRYRRAAQNELEKMVSEKNNLIQEIKKQKSRIIEQKNEVDLKNKELKDSVYYAKKIQSTILSNHDIIDKFSSEHFLLFKPKDIISGDFCFSVNKNGKLILAICDSTGHGVPGAFISILNTTYLFQAINEKNIEQPNLIFDFVKTKLQKTLSKEFSSHGMDGLILNYDVSKKKIEYTSANSYGLFISDNKAHTLNKDKMHVGMGESEGKQSKFSLHKFKVKAGDVLYIYTDGYFDQFGGNDSEKRKNGGKKFKRKNLNDLLTKIHKKSMKEQYEILNSTLKEWIGKLDQTDDITVFGVKF